jgi:hypothetical protein
MATTTATGSCACLGSLGNVAVNQSKLLLGSPRSQFRKSYVTFAGILTNDWTLNFKKLFESEE